MSINITERIKEVLQNGHLISLGTAGSTGVWVSDVIYCNDENLNIYWMSDPDCRHSKALLENNKVAGTITLSNKRGEKNLGIQIAGIAEKIDGARYDIAKLYYSKRGKPEPKESDDILQGDSWYILKPSFIELIDEENFGFNKQKINI